MGAGSAAASRRGAYGRGRVARRSGRPGVACFIIREAGRPQVAFVSRVSRLKRGTGRLPPSSSCLMSFRGRQGKRNRDSKLEIRSQFKTAMNEGSRRAHTEGHRPRSWAGCAPRTMSSESVTTCAVRGRPAPEKHDGFIRIFRRFRQMVPRSVASGGPALARIYALTHPRPNTRQHASRSV